MGSAHRHLRLCELSAHGYRNLAPLTLEPGPRFNVISGDNGAGKSNLLEAIDYIGSLRSFRSAKTADLVGKTADACRIRARLEGGVLPSEYEVTLSRERARAVKVNGKRPRSIASYNASIQVVLFHPGDVELGSGPPDARRAFLDRILSQMDPTYSSALSTYQKALRSRNRLLRFEAPDRRAIEAFNPILASSGSLIGQTRAQLVVELASLAEGAFRDVVGSELPLSVRYQPRVEPSEEAILKALSDALSKDLARGFTADGPHADDLLLNVSDTRAKHHASQGQHRAIVLALKVAELHVLAARVGLIPVLLLDDVSSELDRARNRRFFEVLANLGGQVFLTTTHPEFILLEGDRIDFHVADGVVTKV